MEEIKSEDETGGEGSGVDPALIRRSFGSRSFGSLEIGILDEHLTVPEGDHMEYEYEYTIIDVDSYKTSSIVICIDECKAEGYWSTIGKDSQNQISQWLIK